MAKPATMAPPPPGAQEGDRPHGLGLGLLVGVLLGLAIGAVTLLVFAIMRRDIVENVVNNSASKLNPPIVAPRPVVKPAPSTPSVTPVVTSASPLDSATDVPPDADVILTFASDMDSTTLTSASVTVYDAAQGKNISADLQLTYRGDAKQLTISWGGTGNWGSGNTVDIEVSTLAKDIAGQPLAEPFRMTFSTRK